MIELEHVPTCAELVQQGLARAVGYTKKGASSTYTISDEGHRLLGEIMRRNGAAQRAHDEAHPSRVVQLRAQREAARRDALRWAEDAFAE